MNQFRRRISITYILIGINLAVFVATYLFPGLYIYLAIFPYGLIKAGFFWTPLTYMFTHGGFTHILFNTIFLIFVGPAVEERMGAWEFLAFYLVSGILAGLISVFAYLFTGYAGPIVGASGALYAVMLAFATYNPRARFLIFFVIPIQAPYAIALFAAIDVISHIRGAGGVAHLTHLSGLLIGYLYLLLRLKINPIKEMKDGR